MISFKYSIYPLNMNTLVAQMQNNMKTWRKLRACNWKYPIMINQNLLETSYKEAVGFRNYNSASKISWKTITVYSDSVMQHKS